MSVAIARPEKITKFLSYMFPTERDRLYFEMVRESVGITTRQGTYRSYEVIIIEPSRIELEMPNNEFLLNSTN